LTPKPLGQFTQAGSESVKPVFEPALYLPEVHGCVQLERDVDPIARVEEPAGHTTHAGFEDTSPASLLLPVLYFPKGHLKVQAKVEVEPETKVVFPAEHREQAVFPMEEEYFPMGQVTQLLPPLPYFPGTHSPVSVHTLLPGGAEVPSRQAVHIESPELAAIVFAKHNVQLLDPARLLNLPGEQDSHALPPKLPAKVPALQSVHEVDPE